MTYELAHHGILGMKWGVRRTPAQLGHKTTVKVRKTAEQKASERQKRADARNRGTLSDAELAAKVGRLQLEKQLRELTDSEVNAGRKQVQNMLESIGTKVITTAASGALLYGAKAMASGTFDPIEFGNAIFNGGAKKK